MELRNCFSILEEPSAMKVEPIINNKWNAIKTAYSETAQNVLGFKQNVAEEWISATTWQRIEESRQLKAKVLNTKSQRLHEKAEAFYTNKDREVKRCARREKRAFIENLPSEAEKAAAYGNLANRLYGKCTTHSTHVRDKNGNICPSEREQAARWVQHFEEVLNLPEPV